jgi:hypothetical protein
MLNLFNLRLRRDRHESGQVMVIFAFAFVVIVMMLGLLFDAGQALALRRELKNASDAAAMAAANVIQVTPKGCSATPGSSVPRPTVIAAAKASVALNLPGYDLSKVAVTCVTSADALNSAVSVQLGLESATFFGSIFGQGPLTVNAKSSALNGSKITGQFSVVLLDPYNPTWHSSYQGCPSFLLSGGPTLTFESTIFVDSACLAANGGAFSTNGNAATLTFVNVPPNPPSAMRIVGEYKPTALTVTPAPLEHQLYKPDPFLFIVNEPPGLIPGGYTLKVQSAATKSINTSTPVLLQPGIYRGGIKVGAQGVVYLAPGIYVMDGGGFFTNAGAQVYGVPAGINAATYNVNTWSASCSSTTCGILIYNKGTSSGVTKWGPVFVNASSTFKVRAYNPAADTTLLSNNTAYVPDPLYKGFLIWQSRTPAPFSNTVVQEVVTLGGGGSVFMAGTVYAPNAQVLMKGGAGGGAGGDLTLQFVAWDLQLDGNSNFYFHYDAQQFPQLLDYGLIE